MFPWQKQETVRLLPNRLDTHKTAWCRDARLVYVSGTGVLRWESCGLAPDPEPCPDQLLRLTLRGTPLLTWQDPVCPTCQSLLAAGWGLDAADCPELAAAAETLNTGFTHLEDAVPQLTPLLGLLPTGLYLLADGDACPADGDGRFFWDVPDDFRNYTATAPAELADDDYDYEWPDSAPVFLYPSQRRSRLDPARVDFYMDRLQQDGPPPRGIAFHVTEGMSMLLDGHHKAAAAARLGRALACVTILPLGGYTYRSSGGRLVRDKAMFGPFQVPVKDLPAKWLPEPETLWHRPEGKPAQDLRGRLADRVWPEAYRAAGARYPTQQEYALVTAAGVGYPTDEDLETWLGHPLEDRPKLRGALVILRCGGDPRLKSLALRCASIPDQQTSAMKEEAFRILAAMHGDADVENFFVNYFIQLDESHGAARLTDIANTFWN